MDMMTDPIVAEGSAARIRTLRERMHRLQQRPDLGVRVLPTLSGVGSLLPGGALRPGASYAVDGSIGLVMALMAGPVAAGAWAGVIGVPEFGAEAAAGMGIELSRVALVPRPGEQWLSVAAALADALDVVVLRPPGRVSEAAATRLSARLRRRDGVLIACGDWPRAEVRMLVLGGGWQGLGFGEGHLTGRRAAVQIRDRGGRLRERGIELPITGSELAPARSAGAAQALAGEAMPPRFSRVS